MTAGIPEDVSAKIVAAIRANHLKANIDEHEGNPFAPKQTSEIHWEKAWVDPGGTIFGPGPYLKVPITLHFDPPVDLRGLHPKLKDFAPYSSDEITVRVYAPERLRRKLAKLLPGKPSVESVDV